MKTRKLTWIMAPLLNLCVEHFYLYYIQFGTTKCVWNPKTEKTLLFLKVDQFVTFEMQSQKVTLFGNPLYPHLWSKAKNESIKNS